MDTPIPAPRSSRVKNTGARAKVTNGLGPPRDLQEFHVAPKIPVRKKKKEAPSPPMGSFLHSSSSISSLPKNSTMMSSSVSLPGLNDDVSPIRPVSAMSNFSTTSTRSHKKRRAPPPPVQPVIKPIPEENPPENLSGIDLKTSVSNYSIISSSERDLVSSLEETLHSGHTDLSGKDNMKPMYAKVNKVKTQAVDYAENDEDAEILVEGEFKIHESIIICNEDEEDNHVYETVKVENELSSSHAVHVDIDKPDTTNLSFNSPTLEVKNGFVSNEEIVGVSEHNDDLTKERKKKKKKDKDKKKKKEKRDKNKEDPPTPTYENIVSEDERLLRESLETVNDEPLSIESNLTPKEEQNVLNDTGKEKDKRLSDNHSQSDAQNEVHDLPNFRRAVAVDVHRISQNPGVEATNCDENDVSSENDSLVNSDDELVDLFAIPTTAKLKPKNELTNETSNQQHEESNLKSNTHCGTNSSDPAIQDTDSDASDGMNLLESEDESKYLSLSGQDVDADKKEEPIKKISGKTI